jgi:hypothetical protein
MIDDVVVGMDPALDDGLVAVTVVGAKWWTDEAVCRKAQHTIRRARIRAAARARRARRGWR